MYERERQGRWLKDQREGKKLTIPELAISAFTDYRNVHRLEAGLWVDKRETLKILSTLGVTSQQFYNEKRRKKAVPSHLVKVKQLGRKSFSKE